MKENKNMKCDPCERDFEHKIHELVQEGKAPSHEARQKKEHEVKAAFREQRPAGHAPAMPKAHKSSPAKQPAMAGAAKAKK